MLQFAKTKSNNPSTKIPQVTDQKLHESLTQHSQSKSGASLSDAIEWIESEQVLPRLTTQSLSAVKRKEQYKVSSVGGGDCRVDEVLQALKMENESLTNLQVHTHNKPQLIGDKGGDMKMSGTINGTENSSVEMAKLENDGNSASSVENPLSQRIKGPLLPSLPFKPVLVNRYKQASITAARTLARRETATKALSSAAEEESSSDVQLQRRGSPSEVRSREIDELTDRKVASHFLTSQVIARSRDQSKTRQFLGDELELRGREDKGRSLTRGSVEVGGREVVSESLTEHTVKIITDKVRQMDAR